MVLVSAQCPLTVKDILVECVDLKDVRNKHFVISPYSVAFGVILSLLFFFVCFFCTVEDISTQDGAIGVKFWLRVEQTPETGTR